MKYSVDKSQQQVVVVTCSNANQNWELRCGKQHSAEDGSELSVLSISQFFQCHLKETVMSSETKQNQGSSKNDIGLFKRKQ